MLPKGLGNLVAFSAREVKRATVEERRIFLCRRTVRVEVKSKVIPASFLKIEERRGVVEAKD